jgi:hypothetical protein
VKAPAGFAGNESADAVAKHAALHDQGHYVEVQPVSANEIYQYVLASYARSFYYRFVQNSVVHVRRQSSLGPLITVLK